MTAINEDSTDPVAAATPPAGGVRPLMRGIAELKRAVKRMPTTPGVYRMVDSKDKVLYVGKARNLRHRVNSYTQIARLTERLRRMVADTARVEIVTTNTEVEALLLEANLIKRFRPRYNITLRDDKSYPYILLNADHQWPRAVKYRGARSRTGEYFGPFASAGAVNRTLNTLERAFLLRSCSDSMLTQRTRPCLKHQLKRCSAPCVGLISPDGYRELVDQARAFLSGRSRQIQTRLAADMQDASDALDFERAARYRDRIHALAQVQAHQDINLEGARIKDADVIAVSMDGGQACVEVFFFRASRNNGNRAYFPRHDADVGAPQVLAAFIGQFYDNKPSPRLVLLSHPVAEQALVAAALSLRSGQRVAIECPRRGTKRRLIEHALMNAGGALAQHLADGASQQQLLEKLVDCFGLEAPPRRIEVYDNSHISGTHQVGAMIVAGPEGFVKSAYRKFNIKGLGADAPTPSPGDDYAMLREVLTRRFRRVLKDDPDHSGAQWPDLCLIDGGRGQLNVACDVLQSLGIDDMAVVGIAKGPDRDAGRERFFQQNRAPFRLAERDPVLFYLQRLRDEAHRFAIGTHRAKRSKAIERNPLDDIAGIGAKRKRALLHHFGSARSVARAGLDDLGRVAGISKTVARLVYDHFRGDVSFAPTRRKR